MPAFYGMGVTDRMKPQRRPLDRRINPCLLAVGAGQDDLVKGAIAGDRETAGPYPPRQRAREVKAVEWNDRPAARLDPEDVARFAAVGHWENACGIASQKHSGI